MPRFSWAGLNNQQVGRYAEYFVKMEFTMHGFQVFTAEVDDHGVDFVASHGHGAYYEVQVKSLREKGYIFIPKTKARLSDGRLVAVVLFTEGHEPDLFLIPMTVWKAPDTFFVDRDYVGLESKPEYGINLSARNRARLEPYRFHTMMTKLRELSSTAEAE